MDDNKQLSIPGVHNIRVIERIARSKFNMKFKSVDSNRIKKIVTLVRKSPEYKGYIKFLKKTLNINNCAFYKGYSGDMGFILEMHHHPFRLYEYVETVCYKQFSKQGYIKTSEVMLEVLKLHIDNQVGLIPLSPTAHKLNHSDNLYIHPELVLFWKGNQRFISEYKTYMTQDLQIKIDAMYSKMKIEDPTTFPEILKEKKLILDEKEFILLTDYNVPKLLAKQAIKRLEQI